MLLAQSTEILRDIEYDNAAGPDRMYVIDAQGKVAYNGARGPQGFKPDEAEAALKKVLAKK